MLFVCDNESLAVGERRERHLDVPKATPQSAMLTAPLKGSLVGAIIGRPIIKDVYKRQGDVSTVTVHIQRVRDKINTENERYIETIWGVGYRFNI